MPGQQPFRTQPEKRVTDRAKRVSIAVGPFAGGLIHSGILADRMEWVWYKEEPGPQFDLLGRFPDDMTPFRELTTDCLARAPEMTRLAFGATLLYPVHDLQTGYRQLAAFLPSIRLDGDMSDLFFKSTGDDLHKWDLMVS